jgi:type I restriction enzyme S subunit
MKESIKKRIEAVRRGKVPEKYSTERAMLFPDEWGTPVALNTVLSENKDCNEDLRFGKEDVLSVSGEQGIVNQIDLLGRSYAGQSVAPYHVVETGDVVYTKSPLKENPYGIIKQNRGVPGIVSTLYAVYHCSTPITGQYLENYFCIDTYLNNYLKPLVKRGAKNDMKVNNEEVLLGRIPLPPLQEQERINEIITQFDRMIELKQSKIDELNKLKQVCLLEMFPQKGQTIPKRRFLGFSAPWEQRKLGDIADIVGGGTPSTGNQSYWDGDIDWYAPAEIANQIYANSSQKKITGLGYENSSAKMLPPGTVLFTSRAGIGKTAILTRKGCTNQGFQSIVPHRGALDSYFIFSRTGELKRYGELVGAGSTFVEVSGKQMAAMELMMPPTMREQQTIGGFFQQLDHLITLHQRELAEVGKYKKALMQLLLTGLVRVNA